MAVPPGDAPPVPSPGIVGTASSVPIGTVVAVMVGNGAWTSTTVTVAILPSSTVTSSMTSA